MAFLRPTTATTTTTTTDEEEEGESELCFVKNFHNLFLWPVAGCFKPSLYDSRLLA